MWRKRLEEKLRLVPARPGVYLLKNARGEILYIGKAKRLPGRVRSYFRGTAPDVRLEQLRSRVRDFDYVVTANEAEALVLEANLVKSHAPFFNIELKDDKKYPFLKIGVRHAYPRLLVTRTVVADGSRYFGPFVRVKDLRQVLRSLQRLFPLRSCTDRRLAQGGRECLKYSLGLCPAPCTGKADPDLYRQTVERLVRFFEGGGEGVLRHWERRMRALAKELRFEESAQFRDDIQRLATLGERQRMTDLNRPDLDAIALACRGNRALATMFSHREGKVVGMWRLSVGEADQAAPPAIMATVLAEHYQGRDQVPPIVLTNILPTDQAVLEGWLSEKAGRRVRLVLPRRGPRAELIRVASENAALALEEVELLEAGTQERLQASAYVLQDALGLSTAPYRIEGFDISNLQGRMAVGSQVVFRNGQPHKSGYRRYRIRLKDSPDDVAMMAEMIERRAGHFADEEAVVPDLILIDGGKGQVNRAADVLRDAGYGSIPVVGLAKREEELFLPGEGEPVRLPRSSSGLQLLQRVRDEAHRFAVGYHRRLRREAMTRDPLSAVRGLGAKRRQALMARFGDLVSLAKASEGELMKTPGVGPNLAREIAAALRRGGRRG